MSDKNKCEECEPKHPFELKISCETREEARDYLKAFDYKDALEDMWNRIFRPRHKHGYGDQEINEILGNSEECNKVIDYLEEIYHKILEDKEV